MGYHTPQEWGWSLSCTGVTGDFAPLLNTAAGRGAKADMIDNSPHWLEGWTLPLAFGMMHGILGQDFWSRACQRQFLSPPPVVVGGGCMSTVTSSSAIRSQCGPVSKCLVAQTPKDSWSWTVTGDQPSHLCLWYFWVGKEVPGTTLKWAGRGWQGGFSLGVLEGMGFETETYHCFQRPCW